MGFQIGSNVVEMFLRLPDLQPLSAYKKKSLRIGSAISNPSSGKSLPNSDSDANWQPNRRDKHLLH